MVVVVGGWLAAHHVCVDLFFIWRCSILYIAHQGERKGMGRGDMHACMHACVATYTHIIHLQKNTHVKLYTQQQFTLNIDNQWRTKKSLIENNF
jgi:hypothetical protein